MGEAVQEDLPLYRRRGRQRIPDEPRLSWRCARAELSDLRSDSCTRSSLGRETKGSRRARDAMTAWRQIDAGAAPGYRSGRNFCLRRAVSLTLGDPVGQAP